MSDTRTAASPDQIARIVEDVVRRYMLPRIMDETVTRVLADLRPRIEEAAVAAAREEVVKTVRAEWERLIGRTVVTAIVNGDE